MAENSTFRLGNFAVIHFSISTIAMYLCMAIVGIISNVVTCIVIISNKSMHTATNCYLFNLAVSDLFILIWAFPLYNFISYNSDFICQSRVLIAETGIFVTTLTLSVFSVERYLAICHPLRIKLQLSSLSRAMKSIPVIWFIGFCCAYPLSRQFGVVHHVNNPSLTACTFIDKSALYVVEAISFSFFIIPMLLIFIMYLLMGSTIKKSSKSIRSNNELSERSKQQTPKMLIAVVGAFFVCWAPVHTWRLLSTLSRFQLFTDLLEKITWSFFLDISLLLFYSSSLINPVLYNIMSKKFRQAFKDTLLKCCHVKDCCTYSTVRIDEQKRNDANTDESKL